MASDADCCKLFQDAQETSQPAEAKIKGTFPSWLKGTFVRVGPGKWTLEEHTMNHWLDGFAIVSKFSIEENSVKLEKKFLQSDAYKRALAAKKPVVNEYGTRAFPDPNKGFFSRIVSNFIPEMSDNSYSTPFLLGKDDVHIFADTAFFRGVNMSGFSGDGEKFDVSKCFGCNALSAHPMKDENGDSWQIGSSLTAPLKYLVVKIPQGDSAKDSIKKAKTICSITTRWNGAMANIHSFGMTPNYIILIEQPSVICLSKILASSVKGYALKDWVEWRPQDKNRFYIVEKATGKVIKTEFMSAEAFFYMHVINAYEENDQIVIDVNSYESPSVMETLVIAKFRKEIFEDCDHPYAQRFVIPLADVSKVQENENLVKVNGKSTAVRKGNQIILTPEILTDIKGAELQSFNKKCNGKKYTYYYTAGTYNPSHYSHSICKVNVETKEMILWKENDYIYPGEPYFIPKPDGTDEDDGVVISAVADMRKEAKDYLLVLDAKTLTELGRATFEDVTLPCALHGIFIPSA